MPFLIRPFQSEHLAFVIDSWLKSAKDSPAFAGADSDDYFPEMRVRIRRLLQRDGVTARVAVSEDGETYLGWAVYEGDVLHYVYVKHDVRKLGIAKALLEGAELSRYSHKTARTALVPKGWAYDPFAGVMR